MQLEAYLSLLSDLCGFPSHPFFFPPLSSSFHFHCLKKASLYPSHHGAVEKLRGLTRCFLRGFSIAELCCNCLSIHLHTHPAEGYQGA